MACGYFILAVTGVLVFLLTPVTLQLDDVFVIYTDVSLTENGNLVHVENKGSFNFRLRACAHGIVYLRESSDYSLRKWIQVELGYEKNSKSRIRGPSGKDYTSLSTPDILHCSEFRTFWVDWVQKNIRVGYGPSPGYQIFLTGEIPDEDNFDMVISVSLSTAEGYAGTWEINEREGREVSVTTPADESFRWLWRTTEGQQDFLSFGVGSCIDVIIGLGREVGRTEYIVTLARKPGNKHSISKNHEVKAALNASDVDSCMWSAAFWVGWEKGLISAGRGLFKGREQLIQWSDNEFESIGAMAFGAKSTSDHMADAIWEFHSMGGSSYMFFSNPKEDIKAYDNWIYAPRDHSIRFHVEGCRDVYVVLSPEVGSVDFPETLYVVLGVEGNSRCKLLDHSEKELESVKCEHVLGCNTPRPFWITWRDGNVKLGQGMAEGTAQIFSKAVNNLDKLSGIGFGNTHQDGAFWVTRPVAGDKVALTTRDDVNATTTWVPMPLHALIEFQVTAATDAYLYLYKAAGIYQEKLVAVVLGYDNDKHEVAFMEDDTVLRRCRCDEPVLNPDQANPFYIVSSTITVSLVTDQASYNQRCQRYYDSEEDEEDAPRADGDWAGSEVTGDEDEDEEDMKKTLILCEMPSKLSYSARAAGLASRQEALWEFQIDSGDEIRMTSVDPSMYDSWRWFELTEASSGVMFRAKGTEMWLLLSEGYLNKTSVYEVHMTGTAGSIERDDKKQEGTFTLDKSQVLDYWISWQAGTIILGISEVPGKNVQLTWTQASDVEINALAVNIPNRDTELRFIKHQAVETQFVTAETTSNNQVWIQMREEKSMLFAVKSCMMAEIDLSSLLGTTEASYRVRIGISQNTKTAIYRNTVSTAVIEVDSPDILSCDEERIFWLLWGAGELALGEGSEIGRQLVINWYDLSPQPVTALQFLTGYNNLGEWRVRLDEGRDFEDKASPNDKTTPPPTPTDSTGGGLSSGDVAGIVIGVMLLCALALFGVYVLMRGVPGPIQDTWYSAQLRFSSPNQPQQFQNEA